MGVSAGGDWNELHRGVSYRSPVQRVYRGLIPNSPWCGCISTFWYRVGAALARFRSIAGLLAPSVLDVPKEDISASLMGKMMIEIDR